MKFVIKQSNVNADLVLEALRAKFEEIDLERLSGVALYCAGGPKMEYEVKIDKEKWLLQPPTAKEREVMF